MPVAFALGLACVPVFFIDDRLTPFLLLNEMLKSYNSFLLLAIPFFMLAANLMNVGRHHRQADQAVARAWSAGCPGGLAHVNVLCRHVVRRHLRLAHGGSRGRRGVLIPAMKKQGYDIAFAVALIAVRRGAWA